MISSLKKWNIPAASDTSSHTAAMIPERIINEGGISVSGQPAITFIIQYSDIRTDEPNAPAARSIPWNRKPENSIIPRIEQQMPAAMLRVTSHTIIIIAV